MSILKKSFVLVMAALLLFSSCCLKVASAKNLDIQKGDTMDDKFTDYLFVYFPYANVQDERVYFATSTDGLNFKALNEGQPVLESTVGTHGIRDPFIIRSHDGSKFYLIATDLTVSGITQDGTFYPGLDWGHNQTQGSKNVVIWQSDNLCDWSQPRLVKVADDTAGCAWAPEAYFDDETDQYVMYFASKSSMDDFHLHRVWYVTTKDFETFSQPKIWIQHTDSVIDTTVIKGSDGYYYRYTKNEGWQEVDKTPAKRVFCERSRIMLGTWEKVCDNVLDYSGGQIEGPTCYKINEDDKQNVANVACKKGINLDVSKDIYCLCADATNVTIFPGLSNNLSDKFNILGETKGAAADDGTPLYTMPEPAASHGTIIPITHAEYTNLQNKFGHISNTNIEYNNHVEIEASKNINLKDVLPKNVNANYTDGSSAYFGVDYADEELSQIDATKPGTYKVHGNINQTIYKNPFIEKRADPCILKGRSGDGYFFTASDNMCGHDDVAGYSKILLIQSQNIEGLSDAADVEIYDCNKVEGEYRFVWAPEICLIGDEYYIFYTSSVSGNVWDIKPHVLKCTNKKDILNPDSWQCMGVMQKFDQADVAFNYFSLDMTVFENKGVWYAIWAQKGQTSDLYIATIDKNEPWKLTSKSTKISSPTYPWERVKELVNEGPSVIKNDATGKIFVSFSSSATGPEYCVGLLEADMNSNLQDALSWTKTKTPVLTSSDVDGEYGPGHNSFTKDEYGCDIFVYHARGQECASGKCKWAGEDPLYDPCRDARIKRVHWNKDGKPVLNMTYDEELLPQNRSIEVDIVIKNSDSDKNDNKNEDSILPTDDQKFDDEAIDVKPIIDDGEKIPSTADNIALLLGFGIAAIASCAVCLWLLSDKK